ncbi:plasmid mobilization relaxosome protein MobC [Mucilaginibacter sp. PAMB04274]|uniref:plasmid mobilization protein n=1 Tax=Mucilaginibacter sp. PAMB04274 TaxID=3138568 RepID=UPI0031F6DE8B
MINVRFTEEEFKSILQMEADLGISRTDLIRARLLNDIPQRVINAKEAILQLDRVGTELGRSGNNINQLARYANILKKQHVLSQAVIERFLILLETYHQNQADLEATLRKMIRLMTQP